MGGIGFDPRADERSFHTAREKWSAARSENLLPTSCAVLLTLSGRMTHTAQGAARLSVGDIQASPTEQEPLTL